MSTYPEALIFLGALAVAVGAMRFLAIEILLKIANSTNSPQMYEDGAETSDSEVQPRAPDGWRVIRCLLLAAGLIISAFLCLTIAVLHWNRTSAIDLAVNDFFQPFRAPWLLHLFVEVTSLGTIISMGMLVAVVSVLLWSMRRSSILLPLWASFLGAEVTTWVAKYAINRARPVFIDGITEFNPSFPSGHATASTVVIGFIGFVIARELSTKRMRAEVGVWSAMAIAAICLSRLFLSLHYLSDVLAGVLVGSAWLLIGIAINEWRGLEAKPLH
ncbi:phosphatase PAP2 family protein [Pseudomonas sp. AO-1]|uniref:phosphatase PAP2 family protein n=1 Tax=Pseudomonas sp. AO-1 TaxID=2855434 RepID=UPI001C78F796|nr:phosphatase PAP2 family protein [Pseudomonas sp. AO-1]QXZ13733.1 phosphatase PAP2 family protein [Pseudomonas sp. AO-1]